AHNVPWALNVIDPFPLPMKFHVLPTKHSAGASSNTLLIVKVDGKFSLSIEFSVQVPLTADFHSEALGPEDTLVLETFPDDVPCFCAPQENKVTVAKIVANDKTNRFISINFNFKLYFWSK